MHNENKKKTCLPPQTHRREFSGKMKQSHFLTTIGDAVFGTKPTLHKYTENTIRIVKHGDGCITLWEHFHWHAKNDGLKGNI